MYRSRTALIVCVAIAFTATYLPVADGRLAGRLEFTRPMKYSTGAEDIVSAAVRDFNRDRWQDVVVGHSNTEAGPERTTLLLGKGRGRFSRPTRLAANSPSSVAVADVNRDGKADLVRPPKVLLGDGKGRFPQRVAIPSGEAPQSVGVGDFNRDHWPDLAVVDKEAAGAVVVRVLLGDTEGGFSTASAVPAGDGDYPDLGVGDFNGDRISDVVVTSQGGSGAPARLLLGDKGGQLSQVWRFRGPERYFFQPIVADFNRDQKLDVALSGSRVLVMLGSGRGDFVRRGFGAGRAIGGGDLNGDRAQDLVTLSASHNQASVLLGNGRGGFARVGRFPVGDFAQTVEIVDVNRDRKRDLVVGGYGVGLRVLLNQTGR